MKVGIGFANIGPFGTAEGGVTMARAAEAAGSDSLWTVEHVVYPDDYGSTYPYDESGRMAMAPDTDLTDPLTWLTWVGARPRPSVWPPESSSFRSATRWSWPSSWAPWTP